MKSRYLKSLAIPVWVVLGNLPVAAQAQLVDLGAATGYAINNSGQVALSTGIYSNGTVTALPALPGQTTPATPLAINASGQAAGFATTQVLIDNGSGATKPGAVPVLYSNGTLTNISLLFPQYTAGQLVEPGIATAINTSGQVAGYYMPYDPRAGDAIDPTGTDGFLDTNGVITGISFAYVQPYVIPVTNVFGINDSGQLTGTGTTNGGPNCIPNLGCNESDAFVYDSKTGAIDLGWGIGYAINNAGQATGTLDVVTYSGGNGTVTGSYAFLYTDGTTIKLGTLPGANDGVGNAINSTGQVVGSSGGHAFFYNGAMNDLNALISPTDPLKPYVTLTSAVGINDSSLILANGMDSRDGQSHAYLYQTSLIQLAPATLDFGTLAVGGTSPALSVTVTNTGTAAIPFGTPYVNGDFSLRADNCGTSLAPGTECRMSVVFVPKVAGALAGALTIPADGANYRVPLSGIAPITAKISASSNTATVGQPLTLAWAVSAGSTCSATSSSTNAKWTASNPPFAGTVPVSGNKTLTETVNGTVNYTLNCTAPGVPAVTVSTPVAWNWPAVTASISASPTSITAGKSTTLTWKSSNATGCTATGGGPDDDWAGTKAASGTQTVTEPFALDVPSVMLTFGITCNSRTSGLSAKASVNVTEYQAPAGSGGLEIAPAALNFATLAIGGTSEAQSVTLTNAGTTAIPFGTPYVNGDFSLRADNCGTSLAPGTECRMSVVFVPKVAGALTGTLTVPAGGANYHVALSGVAP